MSSAIPVSEFATDTMALVLRLEQRRLGSKAKALFEAMETGTTIIHVPSLVFAEILYLSEKRRIALTLHSVEAYLARFSNCRELPLSLNVIQTAAEIGDIPELHDRLIAATARSSSVELITNDPVIQTSAFVQTVW